MRLHQLTVSGFGPFAGVASVDFDALGQGGLFLLHGATGAGKTTVLDAVCFALYGEVPGGRPRHRLRSDHAGPDTPTEVRLELTLDGRRLELTRRPEYERPKKRGSGTTPERAQSLLREWRDDGPAGPGWQGLSTSHQEIGAEVQSLLGMNREQFCQVVLLPQGAFARFLHAGAQDRAELLGRLFGTGRFRDAESWLDERRREAEKAHGALRADLDQLVHRLHEAAGPVGAALPPPADGPDPTRRRGRPGASPAGDPAAGGQQAGRPAADPRTGSALPFDAATAGTGRAVAGAVAAALGWAAQVRAEARERLTVAQGAQSLAAERYEAARRRAESESALADRQRRHSSALRRQRELAAREEAHRTDAERLALALRAQQAAPLLRLRATAAQARDRAVHDEQAARKALARNALTDPLAAAPIAVLGRAEAGIREELGRLRSLGEAEQRLSALHREQQRLAADQREAERRRDEAEHWLAGWPAERQRCTAEAEYAREAGSRAERLAERLESCGRQAEAAAERDTLASAVAEAERDEQRLRRRALDARERRLALREQRISGMAAELAERLRTGEPCPVCGSAEHPRPAPSRPDRVTRTDEERAEAEQRGAESAAEAAEHRVRELRERAAAAAAAAGPEPLAVLTAAAERLRAEQAAALEAASAAVPAAEELARLEREQQARAAELQTWGERAAAHAAALETLAAEELDLTRRLSTAALAVSMPRLVEDGSGLHPAGLGRAGSAAPPEAAATATGGTGGGPADTPGALPSQRTGEAASPTARIPELSAAADLLAEAASAARSAEAAQGELDRAEQESAAEASAAGFPDAAAAERALLTGRPLAELRERVEGHRTERALLADLLTDPELAAAAALPAADPVAAESARAAADERQRHAFAAVREAERRCADLARLSRELLTTARRLAPVAEDLAVVEGLHGLVRGTSAENRLRMPLETYVLAARLEQVAAAASTRLLRMSSGRYTLRHSDERARGGARSGLGLRVLDAWTGVERDTSTLSGGESFFASLALALGLSDVVTDEAGGKPLDTLFIDEGFGSLDEDTLDDVMDVLDQLRERDRVVGIVSHVADLRRRVPTQLQVLKGHQGSTLRIRGTGG